MRSQVRGRRILSSSKNGTSKHILITKAAATANTACPMKR